MKNKNIYIGNTVFKNPVFLASGSAGYGVEYKDLIDLDKLGAVVTKTISLMPKEGNSGTRLHETKGGLLNSIGLENVGARHFFDKKLPELLETGAKPVVSLACEGKEEYLELLKITSKQDKVEAVELNLSCPNVEEGGMAVGTDPELLSWYVAEAKHALGEMAVLAKLTPNVGDISSLAVASEKAGADGITAINTLLGMDIDLQTGLPVFDRIVAGFSGPAIMPVALRAVWEIAKSVRIPVVGVGGISSEEDAGKFLAAGAAAVQIGTAIFYDPGLPERIVNLLDM